MSFSLEFETDNAAFADDNARAECARILRKVAAQIESGSDGENIRDVNGNRIGEWSADLPEPEEDDD